MKKLILLSIALVGCLSLAISASSCVYDIDDDEETSITISASYSLSYNHVEHLVSMIHNAGAES